MRWRSKRLEKFNRKKEWHDFFCLLPRLIDTDDGEKVWVWMETIERKGVFMNGEYDRGWEFTYRLKNSK
jgi:hypothetical protein